MRSSIRRPSSGATFAAAVSLSVSLAVAACGGAAPTTSAETAPASAPATSAPAGTPASATPVPTTPAEPTVVPGGSTPTPDPLPDDVTTTETEWGTILDAVPATFPVFPGAEPADSPDGPVSAAWLAAANVDEVARWYEGSIEDQGYGIVELSDALEDGSRVLDAWADIMECRLQAAFRPAGESTMITVLYAAACAGGEG